MPEHPQPRQSAVVPGRPGDVVLRVPLLSWRGLSREVRLHLPFSYFVFSIRERSDLTESRKNRELLLRVPLSAALGGLLCFGVMAMVEGGFSGPTFRVLWQFVGQVLPR